MAQLRSFITLLWLVSYSLAMPVTDEEDDDGCWSQPTIANVHVPDSPSAAILAPYENLPTPSPTHHHLHASLPVSSHRTDIPAILGTVFGILIALVAMSFTARYVIRRRRTGTDHPPKQRFAAFRSTKKRLSDESWVSPPLPPLESPGSPLSHDLDLRKLVPVTTPVCTPTETEFDIPVPPVRVPSPVYIPPFSPSPSFSSSPSSISPAPSTDRLPSSSPNPARLSRLLSSSFRDTRHVNSPARPSTAHLIQTARSYAHAYRPSSTTSTSLYTPPTASARLAGTRSRSSFYPAQSDDASAYHSVRDTMSTVTTTDTISAVPHLLHALADHRPIVDPDPVTKATTLKLRLSDASEHARYRLRERERERKRRIETSSKVFKLRDSESVLREIGW